MTEGLDRFEELKQQIGAAFDLPPDAQRTAMVAALQLAHERMVESLAAGRSVDLGAFARITELLDRFAPPPPLPKMEIEFAQGVVDVCPQCGWSKPAAPKPDEPPPDDPSPDKPPPADKPEVSPAAASNVVQLQQPQRLDISASSFHDTILPSGEYAPLKRLQERGYTLPARHSQFGPGVLHERNPFDPFSGTSYGYALPSANDPVANYVRSHEISKKWNGY